MYISSWTIGHDDCLGTIFDYRYIRKLDCKNCSNLIKYKPKNSNYLFLMRHYIGLPYETTDFVADFSGCLRFKNWIVIFLHFGFLLIDFKVSLFIARAIGIHFVLNLRERFLCFTLLYLVHRQLSQCLNFFCTLILLWLNIVIKYPLQIQTVVLVENETF